MPVPAAAAAAPRALETILQDDRMFLHRSPQEVAEVAAQLRFLGVDRVRITAGWSLLAPAADSRQRPDFDAADPAAYEQARWQSLDTAVRAVAAEGMSVMLDAGFWAPRWAAGGGPRARTNVDPDEFAAFATALARRYSGTFVPPLPEPVAPAPPEDQQLLDELFGRRPPTAPIATTAPLPRVDVLALWNEPNHPAFLMPTWARTGGRWQPAAPHRYRAMVAAAYPAVKAARPDATVLIGNTSSTGGSGGRAPVAPLRFVRELACVDRALRPLRSARCARFEPVRGDGYAHHPYSLKGSPRHRGRGDAIHLADVRRLRDTLVRLARAGRVARGLTRIWLTELGYETPGEGSPRPLPARLQARYLPWSEHDASLVPGVRSFAQFLLRDVPPSPTRQSSSTRRAFGQFTSGLQKSNGTPKPAARAFRCGVFAERRGPASALLWVRLRLRRGEEVAAAVQRRLPGGAWRTVARLRMDGHGAASRRLAFAPGARWRAIAGGVTSPSVPTVS